MKSFPILYSRATTGAIQQWQIFVDGGKYWTEAGQQCGVITKSAPTECEPKNVGKANETSCEEQALAEAEAKFAKKLRENHFEKITDIDCGFLEFQLAQPEKKALDTIMWPKGIVLDDKLNGFACAVVAGGAFTRQNKQYHSIPHILAAFAAILQDTPHVFIQGELFNPAYVNDLGKISKLVSVVRQPKDLTPELLQDTARLVQFHWYDGYGFRHPETGKIVSAETPLLERRRAIDLIISHLPDCVQSVHYDIVHSEAEARVKVAEYVARGGEGKVAKDPDAPYQHKRTNALVKLKKFETREFRVVSNRPNPFKEGKGNSKGCAEAVWVENPNGKRPQDKEFKVNIKGPKDELREMYLHPERYRGEWITVEFQEESPYGVPLIPYTDMVMREHVEGKGSVNAGEKTKQIDHLDL